MIYIIHIKKVYFVGTSQLENFHKYLNEFVPANTTSLDNLYFYHIGKVFLIVLIFL